MDTIVDRIRALCQQKKTSITKIEEELGYANGTIGKWRLTNRKAPLEKVIEVAKRLETSTEYLMTGEEQKEEPPVQSGEPLDPVTRELMEFVETASDDERRAVLEMVNLIKKQRRG